MDKITITDARNSLSEEQKSEIITLWLQGGAFNDRKSASERLKEIFAVATNENNKIVAVSTTFIETDSLLDAKLHYVRVFVDEKVREFKVGTDFIVFILNTLDKEYDPTDKNLPIGGAWIVENEIVKKNYKLAVSRHTQSTFYGYFGNSHPGRVRYFSGAKISS